MDILEHLKTFGFAIEENVITNDECNKMAKMLNEIEDEKKVKRTLVSTDSQTVLLNVHLERPSIFLDKISIPKVMDTLSKVFNDEFILSNFNASKSGAKGGNRIHIDSRVPIRDFSSTLQIAALLCIDDFTEKNGATIVWPHSHNSGMDPRRFRDKFSSPGKIYASASKGSVIYTLGQTWHDVGPNIDGSRRWGIIAYYSRWWIKPTFDFTKCGPELYSKLSTKQKVLFGFTSIPPTHQQNRAYTLISEKDLPSNYEDVFKI